MVKYMTLFYSLCLCMSFCSILNVIYFVMHLAIIYISKYITKVIN
jgi:hypothetical protein